MKRLDAAKLALLLALPTAHMAGHLLDWPALRALAAATGAAPAPKVFSAVAGLETYSTAFFLDWQSPDGRSETLALTSDVYARLAGPYNRRNTYGAVLAFGPVLATNPATAPMFQAVLDHALCRDRRVLRELGLDPTRMHGVRLRLEPLRADALGDLPRVFPAGCP